MVCSGRRGTDRVDAPMSAPGDPLEQPVESKGGTGTVLADEEMPAGLEPGQTQRKERLEIFTHRPEAPPCGRRGGWIDHDAPKALSGIQPLEIAADVPAMAVVALGIEASRAIEIEILLEALKVSS